MTETSSDPRRELPDGRSDERTGGQVGDSGPTERPNVVVIMLDDVGFGAADTYGGPVRTPTVQRIADSGLRFTRFHTTGICSPTRASLLTGRDSHRAGVGTVLNSANSNHGYTGVLRDETATIARLLQQSGYSTAAFGKWHLTPHWECSPVGPFTRWPTGRGFDTFYGFMGGETDQYAPTLYAGTTVLPPPATTADGSPYHLTTDLVDQTISWIRMQRALAPERPFFAYLATGATHAPLQVPAEWSDRYRGRFSGGWDRQREAILARQKELGIAPPDTELTARPEVIPAWDSLDADEQAVAERLMEVYAGFLEHTDTQLGRILDLLDEQDLGRNTIVVYLVGDNGSSAEGGPVGSANYMSALQGLPEGTADRVAALDRIGGPDTYPQYPAGWAWALTSPFQWVKQVASHFGGTRNPMVVRWPARISDPGGVRTQFGHVNDLAPTLLAAAGVELPARVDGVDQDDFDGVSLLYALDDASAPERHTTQMFEVYGHRSIYHQGWVASAFHGGVPWSVGRPGVDRAFEDDTWELYDTSRDFSQARDLAGERPDLLADLIERFEERCADLGILPLRDARVARTPMPSLRGERTEFTFAPGAVGIQESDAPALLGTEWTVTAHLVVGGPAGQPAATATGVVMSLGGRSGGIALHLDESGAPVIDYRVFEQAVCRVVGPRVPWGRHQVRVHWLPDRPGRGAGGRLSLQVDDHPAASGTLPVTPPALFSIDETFDIGVSTGSAVGDYVGANPFRGGWIERVDITTRRPA